MVTVREPSAARGRSSSTPSFSRQWSVVRQSAPEENDSMVDGPSASAASIA